MRFNIRAFFAMLATVGVAGCESLPPGRSEPITHCATRWSGDLPRRDETLILRGCLGEDLCAADLTANLDVGVGINLACPLDGSGVCPGLAGSEEGWVDEISIEARWEPALEQPPPELWYEVAVTLLYTEDTASKLVDSDRARLVVSTGDGDVLIDSVSEIAYTAGTTEEGGTCKGVWLDLDGSRSTDGPTD